jgi:HAD superfamily hydrolase (TIGR01509 family)
VATLRGPQVRAVIFDLDGTLVDSEPTYYEADRRLLARRGIAFSVEDKRRYVGGGNLSMMEDLKRRYGLAESPEALCLEKNRLYLELAPGSIRPFPEMTAFVEALGRRGLPLAVASGSSPEAIGPVLESAKLRAAFLVLVSAEEVPGGKPAPDIFLEAARRLCVEPAACLVVEDAWQGVLGARRAGMRCLAIPSLIDAPLAEPFFEADLLVEGGMGTFSAERAMAFLAPLLV